MTNKVQCDFANCDSEAVFECRPDKVNKDKESVLYLCIGHIQALSGELGVDLIAVGTKGKTLSDAMNERARLDAIKAQALKNCERCFQPTYGPKKATPVLPSEAIKLAEPREGDILALNELLKTPWSRNEIKCGRIIAEVALPKQTAAEREALIEYFQEFGWVTEPATAMTGGNGIRFRRSVTPPSGVATPRGSDDNVGYVTTPITRESDNDAW